MKDRTLSTDNQKRESDFELDLDQVFTRKSEPGPPPPSRVAAEEKPLPAKVETVPTGKRGNTKFERKESDATLPFRRFINPSGTRFSSPPPSVSPSIEPRPAEAPASSELYGKKKSEHRLPDLTPNKAMALLEQTINSVEKNRIDPHTFNRLLKFVGICILLGAFGLLIYNYFLKTNPGRTQTETSGANAQGMEAKAAAAKTTLKQYLAADSWEEKLGFVLEPDRERLKMMEYYRTPNSSDPKFIASPTWTPSQIGNHYWFTFHLKEQGTDRTFEARIQETKDGFKLDWENFVALGAMLWENFCIERPSEPTQMRVTIRSSSKFSGLYEDKAMFKAFRIEHQSGPPVLSGYVDASSRLVQELNRALSEHPEGVPVNAYLKCEPGAAADQVRILDLVPDSQRF